MAPISQDIFKLEGTVSVRNTFLHFSSDEEEEEQQTCRRSKLRARTQPTPWALAASVHNSDDDDEEDSTAEEEVQDRVAPTMVSSKSEPTPSLATTAPSTPTTPVTLNLAPQTLVGTRWPKAALRAPAEPIARGLSLEREEGGATRLEWGVDERRISGQDRMFVSPGFQLELPGLDPLPFKLILHAATGGIGQKRFGKGAQGFKSAEGSARVELKCCDDLPADASAFVNISISIGHGDRAQPTRGPALHNLSKQSCCGLPKGEDAWHLPSAIDPSTHRLLVRVLVAPCGPPRGAAVTAALDPSAQAASQQAAARTICFSA